MKGGVPPVTAAVKVDDYERDPVPDADSWRLLFDELIATVGFSAK